MLMNQPSVYLTSPKVFTSNRWEADSTPSAPPALCLEIRRTFVTGGSTHVEIWLGAHAHGDSMRDGLEANWAGAHQESCTQYNVMKVARTLLGWTGAVKFADFLERAMHNGILGTQRGHVPGTRAQRGGWS